MIDFNLTKRFQEKSGLNYLAIHKEEGELYACRDSFVPYGRWESSKKQGLVFCTTRSKHPDLGFYQDPKFLFNYHKFVMDTNGFADPLGQTFVNCPKKSILYNTILLESKSHYYNYFMNCKNKKQLEPYWSKISNRHIVSFEKSLSKTTLMEIIFFLKAIGTRILPELEKILLDLLRTRKIGKVGQTIFADLVLPYYRHAYKCGRDRWADLETTLDKTNAAFYLEERMGVIIRSMTDPFPLEEACQNLDNIMKNLTTKFCQTNSD